MKVVVIGGGAAGFFGAIACANCHPDSEVILVEKAHTCLSKVRISGGGRCNVTHHCFDPKELIQFYPRGGKALLGPFSKFQPKDTIKWFESKGIPLKTESDNRMFPTTDNSETIINCLLQEAKRSGVSLQLGKGIKRIEKTEEGFILYDKRSQPLHCNKLLIATGSHPQVYKLIEQLGHTIIPPIPSLFTFNVPSSPLLELSGISVKEAEVTIQGTKLKQKGPLLLTHWGFSGPAILKLSAWGARILHEKNYRATLQIDWIPTVKQEEIFSLLEGHKKESPQKLIRSTPLFNLPSKLWQQFTPKIQWKDLSKKAIRSLTEKFKRDSYTIEGKTTFKEEFVTCGGVALNEVNFTTMESKKQPGLYFAGEVLDIDGVTGGFNFQNAWTTAWIAGNSM